MSCCSSNPYYVDPRVKYIESHTDLSAYLHFEHGSGLMACRLHNCRTSLAEPTVQIPAIAIGFVSTPPRVFCVFVSSLPAGKYALHARHFAKLLGADSFISDQIFNAIFDTDVNGLVDAFETM